MPAAALLLWSTFLEADVETIVDHGQVALKAWVSWSRQHSHDLVNTLDAVRYLFEKNGAAPTPAPTTASECPVGNMNFAIVVKTDSYANETSWWLHYARYGDGIMPGTGMVLIRLERAMRTARQTEEVI